MGRRTQPGRNDKAAALVDAASSLDDLRRVAPAGQALGQSGCRTGGQGAVSVRTEAPEDRSVMPGWKMIGKPRSASGSGPDLDADPTKARRFRHKFIARKRGLLRSHPRSPH